MKIIFLILTIMAIHTFIYGQYVVYGNYNRSTYSANGDLMIGKQFNSHLLSVGLRINDPKSSTEPLPNIDVHPTNFSEMLGVKINYKYFPKTNLAIDPYFLISGEYSHSPLRSDYLSEMSADSVKNPKDYLQYYHGWVRLTDPYHIYDLRLGLGFTADVTKNIYFNINFGSGLTWMNYDEGDYIIVFHGGPGINNYFGVGIGYRFQSKSKG